MTESQMDVDSSQSTTKVSGIDLKDPVYTSDPLEYRSIEIPKRSAWQVSCADIIWNPREGHEPNWFHRKMQEFCFGFKWRKK